ncbi:SpoVA/SpoVAEb family sporulation membrane protein [Anoxybacteroides amylolyticum]|uniref:SpoVA family protein n=1 Tax=Anoxybacteroides amylolyticum TaxID=294699 RepID=A0A161HU38_9BACL|nr:SpoVA/SpoVAEb family sporulation membrane protein [Anoxybacillus amylolyticus]ANB59734.1 spoVA family protein [Anoxybacillus amylolyticus]
MEYWLAFLVGGLICGVAQLFIDYKFSQLQVVIGLVLVGVVLGALGVYDWLVDIAGMGALLPMSGFGYWLIKGVIMATEQNVMAAGANVFRLVGIEIVAIIILSFFTALICKPKG